MSEIRAAQARERRKKWLISGLCTGCGKNKPDTGTTCEICRKRKRRHHHNRTNKGICRCQSILEPGTKVCSECSNKGRRRHYELVLATLKHYGPHCKCCSETDYVVLTIDHINGGGNEHARKIGRGSSLYRWLRRNKNPEGFRVLCSNCNHGIVRNSGECPHAKIIPAKNQYAKYIGGLREKAIKAYGGKCLCGISEPLFLHLDHINNDGAEHRRQINRQNLYIWARNNNYPDMLQLLCSNCNLAKERTGFKNFLGEQGIVCNI